MIPKSTHQFLKRIFFKNGADSKVSRMLRISTKWGVLVQQRLCVKKLTVLLQHWQGDGKGAHSDGMNLKPQNEELSGFAKKNSKRIQPSIGVNRLGIACKIAIKNKNKGHKQFTRINWGN